MALGAAGMLLSMPLSASAEHHELWNKLSDVASKNWNTSNTLNVSEMLELQSLAESGDANAQYVIGMLYRSEQNHAQAKVWLKRAAEQGHLPARKEYVESVTASAEQFSLAW